MQQLNQIKLKNAIGKVLDYAERHDDAILMVYQDKTFSYLESFGYDEKHLTYEEFFDNIKLTEDFKPYLTHLQRMFVESGLIDKDQLFKDAEFSVNERIEMKKTTELYEMHRLIEKYN